MQTPPIKHWALPIFPSSTLDGSNGFIKQLALFAYAAAVSERVELKQGEGEQEERKNDSWTRQIFARLYTAGMEEHTKARSRRMKKYTEAEGVGPQGVEWGSLNILS